MSNKTPLPLSKRLKEARLLAGYSQKELGIMAGIDQFSASARMNQYETGKHAPNYNTITNIAKTLGLPVAYFYCIEDDLARLISTWGKLTKKDRECFLEKTGPTGPTT